MGGSARPAGRRATASAQGMLSRTTSARPRKQWRRACGADGEACRGHGGAGAGERPVQAAIGWPGLQACGHQHGRGQHDGGARAQEPRRGGRGPAVVGVVDEADHRRAHRGDGCGERQVAEDPLQGSGLFLSGVAVPGEVEVGPPGTEADHDGDQPDREGEPADRLAGQSGDDTGEGFAEHDDGEQPEPLDERVGDQQRDRLRWGGEEHGSKAVLIDRFVGLADGRDHHRAPALAGREVRGQAGSSCRPLRRGSASAAPVGSGWVPAGMWPSRNPGE